MPPTLLIVAFIMAACLSGQRGVAQPPADLELVEVIPGMSEPIAMRNAGDGSGRLFVVQRGGEIFVFDGVALLATPFLDLSARVSIAGENGLLGLAFHPEYASNGLFFVNYVRDDVSDLPRRTIIERYQVSAGDADVADPSSATSILEIEQPFNNHNGGDIHFGPDGYLYIGMGDGGGHTTAQDMNQLLGKMLRIDVDSSAMALARSATSPEEAVIGGSELCGLVQNYGVPPDNPFVGIGDSCDEIWASGLRNPFRWSFDRETGDHLIGDVGEGTIEEIDFQPAASIGGENYGWPCREGSLDFLPGLCPGAPLLTDPVLEHHHDDGNCSIIGGYVYRGPIGGLNGHYVYDDWCTGEVWFATQTTPGVFSTLLWASLETFTMIGFGEDELGNLYLPRFGGIFRFESQSAAEEIFADGFETGDISSWSASN